MDFYSQHVSSDIGATASFQRAARLVATFAVLTRINKPVPEGVSLLQKALLYDGHDDQSLSPDVRDRIRAEHWGEGGKGFPPSFGVDILSRALRASNRAESLSPFATINLLWGQLGNEHVSYPVQSGLSTNDLLVLVLQYLESLVRSDVTRSLGHPSILQELTRACLWTCANKANEQSSVHPLEIKLVYSSSGQHTYDNRDAIARGIEVLVRLSGPWSDAEERALLVELALVSAGVASVDASQYVRLRRALADLHAIDLAARAVSNWPKRTDEASTTSRSEIPSRVDDPFAMFSPQQRALLLQEPVSAINELAPSELASLIERCRNFVHEHLNWRHELDAYLANAIADVRREQIMNRFTGNLEDPDLNMMRRAEEAAGIGAESAKHLRRDLVNMVGALAIEGKPANLKTLSPALARAIINREIEAWSGDDELVCYEWHIWQKCRGATRVPELLVSAPWMRIIGERTFYEKVALRIGRAVLLEANLEGCPAISATVARAVRAAFGIDEDSRFGLQGALLEHEDDANRYLVDALTSAVGYDFDTASEIQVCARRTFNKTTLQLPFPLSGAGRYRM